MPVTVSMPIRCYDQEGFGKVAYEVVGHAFDIHTVMGKIFHEAAYRSTLGQLLQNRAAEEVEVVVSHQHFEKRLFLDLLVDSGCPFELKLASKLTNKHISQLIQYLMLLGLSHGKLINFGCDEVEHKFVNCRVTLEQRRQFDIQRFGWRDSDESQQFEQTVVSILRDWGTGLTQSLYQEACVELLCDTNRFGQFVGTHWKGTPTGRQPMNLIREQIAIKLTCIRDDVEGYEPHLRRFVKSTDLEAILWANINVGCVRFQRITGNV